MADWIKKAAEEKKPGRKKKPAERKIPLPSNVLETDEIPYGDGYGSGE